MGASESLLAIRGNPLTATIPGFLPGLEGLIYLDVYKITVPGLTGGSYKVYNSSGVIVCSIKSIPTPCCASELNWEVFRVRDPQKRGVLSVYKCEVGSHYYSSSSQPGALIGYVKTTDIYSSEPQYEILFENGELSLLVKAASGYTYNVLSQGGYYQIGQFGQFSPWNTRDMKGSFPRNLDVRMKVGVLLAAVQVSMKVESERNSGGVGGGGGAVGCGGGDGGC
ncbi:uncharacterized protein [Apostichopus japonicus]|uniref:uncharacterized protein isoform X1 n=1 Tax=Stichopus japonicus TaxID=307972 RepID=UPI003AB851FB